MENNVFTKVGITSFYPSVKWLSVFTSVCLFVTGCASSDVSRNTASNVDVGLHNTDQRFANALNGSLSDAWADSSQSKKGALLGGAAGAAAGIMYTSNIGFVVGTATGAVLGASYGAYIDSSATLQDQLINRGVNIAELGDQLLIVVPSSKIFEPLTPLVMPQAYSTLNLLTAYLNQYTKSLIKISVYTADSGARKTDRLLSKQQAKQIEKGFILTGIDARLIVAEGYGSTHLVVPSPSPWQSDNYRIEITLEKLHV